MKNHTHRYLLSVLSILLIGSLSEIMASDNETRQSTRKERNLIRKGNNYYNNGDYSDAEMSYREVLKEAPNSETALFNLAMSLIKQENGENKNTENNPAIEGAQILTQLSKNSTNAAIKEKSYFNLGNLAFYNADYKQSVEYYKDALRTNAENDKTRENLSLALKKLHEQEQKKNKDESQQQQQQNQDKNQDQEQEQNEENDSQNNQDQDKNNHDQQQEEQQPQYKPDDNMEQILEAMEKEDAAVRKKVEDSEKEEKASRKRIRKRW